MTRVLVALLVAIVVGAIALPLAPTGIGWLICAVAGLGVAITARSVRGQLTVPDRQPFFTPPPPVRLPVSAQAALQPAASQPAPAQPAPAASAAEGPAAAAPAAAAAPTDTRPAPTAVDRVWRLGAAGAALLLVAVTAVRASPVLGVFCLLASVALGSYALVGGRSWLRVLGGSLASLPGCLRALDWIARWRPASGASGGARRATPWRVIIAIGVSVLLALILVPLLRSADAVFANLLDTWLDYLPRADGRTFLGIILLAYLGLAAAFFAHRGPVGERVAAAARALPLTGLEWMIPVVMVDVIFAIFVGVQATVLFGGHEYVQRAGGPDYAQYARSGFSELCAVTVLALAIIAGLGALARRETLRQRTMVRTAGGLLCGLTLIIVASALRRMLLYVDAYGFTWLRLLSFSFEIWLGAILVLVLIVGVTLRGGWLPRATMAAATAVLLALVAVNPEAVIARTHIDARLDGGRRIDVGYLWDLSPDALDAVLAMPPGPRACVVQVMRAELAKPDPWYEFNLARAHARGVLAGLPDQPCRDQ